MSEPQNNMDSPENAGKTGGGEKASPGKNRKEKRHLIRPTWLRRTLKTLLGIILFVVMLPALIYIPPVQTFLKDTACKYVAKSTGMKIGIDRFRLRFPLDISLQGVDVVEATGDTMVSAREVIADVKLLPLMKLDVRINRLKLLDGYYRMVSTDSSMVMKIRAGLLDVDGKSHADIRTSEISLNDAVIKNGDVSLFMNVWKKQPAPADTASTPFIIKANRLRMENFGFAMSMLPTIDTLSLRTASLEINDACVDLGKSDIKAGSLSVADGSFTYLTPDPEYVKTHPAPADTTESSGPPMTIGADSIALDRFKVLYATRGVKPSPGFDPGYISLDDVSVGLSHFFNQASTVKLPITRLQARERCGLAITAGRGTVGIDSIGLDISGLELRTTASSISATASVPFALMAMQPDARMRAMAEASIGNSDILAFMPSLKQYISALPTAKPNKISLQAAGSLSSLTVSELKADIPEVLTLAAHGDVDNPLDFNKMRGNLTLDGHLSGPKTIDRIAGGTGIDIPTLTITGTATADRRTFGADVTLLTSAGDAAAKGRVSLSAETYDVHADVMRFDVGRFVSGMGIGRVSADISARGAGFNPTRPGADTDVEADIFSIEYNGREYRDITLSASLLDSFFNIDLHSPNPDLDLALHGKGTLAPDDYTFDITARIAHADLQALGITPQQNNGNADIYVSGSASPERWLYDVDLRVDNLDWNLPDQYLHLPAGVSAKVVAREDMVAVNVESTQTHIDFTSATGLKNVVDAFTKASDTIMAQIAGHRLDIDVVQPQLPPFDLHANASGNGLMKQFLTAAGLAVDTVYANFSNSSTLEGNAGLSGLNTGSMKIDTLTLGLNQRGSLLDYRLHMGNRPGTLDEFAQVDLRGYLGGNRASMSLTQRNIQGLTGYRLGLTAAMADSTVSVHFTPLKATIAYLPWTLNTDNHIDYCFADNHIDANLTARSAESGISLQTERTDKGYDELHVGLDNIHIQDFLQMSVFAPPLTASVSADMRLHTNGKAVIGKGTIDLIDFTYDRQRVGDFNLDFGAGMNFDGDVAARLALAVDGQPKAIELKGVVTNDSVGGMTPKSLTLALNRLPLRVANAFLGKDVASLKGYLSGEMKMGGTFSSPLLDGHVACDSVSVFIPMIGSSLKFDDEPIVVEGNVLRFDKFDIFGANKHPLTLSGNVDFRKFSAISFNLGLKASDFQLIGNDRRAKSDIYGKLFLNLDATARGPMNHFDVNANVNILNKTDITYALPASTASAVEQKSENGVVKFVQFSDTTQVAKADSVAQSMNMRIMAALTITPGTQATVILSSNGTDRVELSPSGNLNYFQNYMGDMRLNGQLNLGNGFARYAIPVAGEKKFDFNPESYVLWNGEITNPILNIKATDRMKANVTQSGANSRLVNFDVKLSVTNTLSNPKILFDLSTDDDITISNELQSMSADQRSNQAMNMLLYGQYTGQGVKASSNLSGNPLYGVLTSQLNSWAANNIRGVDLSFGIDQYDKTTDGKSSTTTSYSYQVSKSLFNNRFKIVVGGNYSTDASADENFAENLINDISFEYMLKQTNTLSMYLRLFRHNGFESIVEGEVTETGVGFVMRKRLSDLRQLFHFRRRKKERAASDNTDSLSTARPEPEVGHDTITKQPEKHDMP